MSIIGEDIFIYTDQTKRDFKHMHNLNGCFINERNFKKIDNVFYNSFSITFLNKERIYYLKDKSSVKKWIKYLKKAIGNKDFFDYYDIIDENIGLNYRLGRKKFTYERVIVKIICKLKMTQIKLYLVKNEINVLQECKHPNIVQCLDYFENSEYYFIVMEYYNHDHSLSEYLESNFFIVSRKTSYKITFQISNALKYLNSFGVIHRDLKPDNIMVFDSSEENFKVKIINFGLSKILGPNEKTVEGYGTLCFAAPEIILREPYNNSVDIWSLGVIVYYIISGDMPFNDTNTIVIFNKILYEEMKFPKQIGNSKSGELKDFISQCLIKDPKKRITIDKLVEHEWLKLSENLK